MEQCPWVSSARVSSGYKRSHLLSVLARGSGWHLWMRSRQKNPQRRRRHPLGGNGAASAFLETIPDFDHPRSASSTAVSSKSAQKANRIRLSGRRLANATPAEIAAIPPSASGNPTTQSTLTGPGIGQQRNECARGHERQGETLDRKSTRLNSS